MVGTYRQTLRLVFAVGFAALMVLQTGCFPTDFTYGKSADKSVNGLSVFANLIRERGHSVTRKLKLSKRIDSSDTIVWAPDNKGLPPENVVARLEQWLGEGNSRVLIYIGRSYDATLPYYRGKFESAPPENREQWQRVLSEKTLEDRQRSYYENIAPTGTDKAYWFEKEEDDVIDTSKMDGPWTEDIDIVGIELEGRDLLKPIEDYNVEKAVPQLVMDSQIFGDGKFRANSLTTKNLLTVDGKPFAFEISSGNNADGKVIIISNASFLLNYSLLNPENRKLASKVADEATGDVVFIESDYRWPGVGGSANDPALHWSWVGKEPMNYIVPHFLFWGVLYCFAFYPNFGRPKRVQFHPPKAFRSHVQAVASILGRSREKSWAREIVNMWLKRNNKSK